MMTQNNILLKPNDQNVLVPVTVSKDMNGGIRFDLGPKGCFVLPPDGAMEIAVTIMRLLGHNVDFRRRPPQQHG